MILSTARVIRKPLAAMPAPAYTDHNRIYIAIEASGAEYELLYRHEVLHIWLEHAKRQRILYINNDKVNHTNWSAAMELEIARNFYSPSDEQRIKDKFSICYGGYIKDSIPDLPIDILIAEDIYDWLEKNKKEEEVPTACCTCVGNDGNDGSDSDDNEDDNSDGKASTDLTPVDAKALIEEVKDGIAKRQELERLAEKYKKLKPKKVKTLWDTIANALREVRVRRPSWSKPSTLTLIYPNHLIKGRAIRRMPIGILVYVDRSASMTPDKTRAAEEAVKRLKRKYGRELETHVLYFGSDTLSEKNFQGLNTPYNLVFDHIKEVNPGIAIIITDNDHGLDPKMTREVLVLPIGCSQTSIGKYRNIVDVKY